jgi:DNA-binding CsgD family transcriptional regulator
MTRPSPADLPHLQQRWLSGSDWQALDTAVGELYDQASDQNEYAQCCFRVLGRLIPHDLCTFSTLDPDTQQITLIVPASVPTELPKAFANFARLHRNYELYSFNPDLQAGRPVMRGDWFSCRQFRDTSIHAEAVGMIGMDDHLSAPVGAPGEATFVALLRHSGGGQDYSERDRTLFATLQPHLRRAWQHTRWRSLFSGKTTLQAEHLRAALGITKRQAEILSWVVAGKTNQEIAIIAALSEGTVKLHLANLFRRLGVETRIAAVRAAWAAVLEAQGPSRDQGLRTFVATSEPAKPPANRATANV